MLCVTIYLISTSVVILYMLICSEKHANSDIIYGDSFDSHVNSDTLFADSLK